MHQLCLVCKLRSSLCICFNDCFVAGPLFSPRNRTRSEDEYKLCKALYTFLQRCDGTVDGTTHLWEAGIIAQK